MAHWTTGELRALKAAHAGGARPRRQALRSLVPRHTQRTAYDKAVSLGLRKPAKKREPKSFVRRLRIAHEHFARREAGLLA